MRNSVVYFLIGLIIKICAILALIVYVESGGSFENLGKSTQLFSADLYQVRN